MFASLLADMGVAVYLPERILDGETVYRDFFIGYFPGSYYFHALLYYMWEPSLSVLQKSIAFSGAAGAGVFYLISKRLAGRTFSIITTALVILWGVINFNIPYPRWYTTTLILIAIYLLCRHAESEAPKKLLWPGIVTGICALFAQNTGVFLLFGIILFLVLEDTMTGRALAEDGDGEQVVEVPSSDAAWNRILKTVFFSVSIVAVIFMIRFHLSIRYLLIFVVPLAALSFLCLRTETLVDHRISCGRERLAKLGHSLIWLLVGFFIPVMSYLIPAWITLGTQTFLNTAILPALRFGEGYFWAFPKLSRTYYPVLLFYFLGVVILLKRRTGNRGTVSTSLPFACAVLLCASLAWPLYDWYPDFANRWGESFTIYIYLPFIAICVSIIVFARKMPWRDIRDPGTAPTSKLLCLFLSLNVALFFQLYPYSDYLHLLWMLPFTFLLTGYLAKALYERARPLSPLEKSSAGVFIAVPFFLLSLNFAPLIDTFIDVNSFFRDGKTARRSYSKIDQYRGDVLVPDTLAGELAGVSSYIRDHTKPSEKILVLPAEAIIYFLSDRGAATRYVYFHPGYLDIEGIDGIPYVLQILDTGSVRFIVVRDTGELSFGYRYFSSDPEFMDLTGYVKNHYSPAARFGRYAVLQRNARPRF